MKQDIIYAIMFVFFLYRACAKSRDYGYTERERDIFLDTSTQGKIIEGGVERDFTDEDMHSEKFQSFISGYDSKLSGIIFWRNVNLLGCTLAVLQFILR